VTTLLVDTASPKTSWRIAGPYFESCNCDAICPCRRIGGRPGTRAQFRLCQFAIGWSVAEGHYGPADLAGRRVVMVRYWDEDEKGTPWRVGVYVDNEATAEQRDVLAGIITGRKGGSPSRQYATCINEVLFVESRDISLVHEPRGRQRLEVTGHVDVAARGAFDTTESVTCGVPGHDRPGYEVVVDHLRVTADGLDFNFEGNCGYVATYDYRSD
jgi:hypothetical protein